MTFTKEWAKALVEKKERQRAERDERDALAYEELRIKQLEEKKQLRARRRIYDATYRNKNKDRLNRKRREKDALPRNVFKKARRRAKYKGQKWLLSFDNWMQVWLACPKVYDEATGLYKTAYAMRSGDINKGTQMRRKDPSKPWQASNVQIIYRNQTIPEHGIVPEWDWERGEPKIPEGLRKNN